MLEESKTLVLGKDDNKLELRVKPYLSIEDRLGIVNNTVENSYIDYIAPSEVLREYSFTISFVSAICPDFPFAYKNVDGEDVIDSNATYLKIKELDIIREYCKECDHNVYDDLYLAIGEAIEFKNHKLVALYAQSTATEDTLNNINSIAEAGLSAMTKLNSILDNVNEMTTDKGLKKLLGSKKVKEFFDSVKDAVVANKSVTDNVINLEDVKK